MSEYANSLSHLFSMIPYANKASLKSWSHFQHVSGSRNRNTNDRSNCAFGLLRVFRSTIYSIVSCIFWVFLGGETQEESKRQ